MSVSDLRRMRGKIALVTGGASGIGRATVQQFHIHGAKVIALDLNQPEDPEEPFPEEVVFLQGSVEDQDLWTNALQRAKERFGATPDVLVQSAGIPGRPRLLDLSMDEWNKVISVNMTSIMWGMRVFVDALVKDGRKGSIVNIASLAGIVAMGGGFAYEATKAACCHMTKTVAWEYASKGIRANAVCPGLTITGMTRKSNRPESSKQYMLDRTPLRRWAEAVETAYMILYLACDESDYVTGQVMAHDGGYSAA